MAAAALAEHLGTYSQPGPMGWCSPPPGDAATPLQLQPAGVGAASHPSGRPIGLRFHEVQHTSAALSIAARASTRS